MSEPSTIVSVEPRAIPLSNADSQITITGNGLGNGDDIEQVTLAGIAATIVSQTDNTVHSYRLLSAF